MTFFKMQAAIGLLILGSSSNAIADILIFGNGSNQFSMKFMPIGSPGNAADTTGAPNPAGAVPYNYQMNKYEVSEDMITKYNANFGEANGLFITIDIRGLNKPATNVNWNEAARFTNWLNTSSGGFAAYKFTTSGPNDNISLWTPADVLDYNAGNPFRSLRANFVLPSLDEWYKAAYFDPSTSEYYDYPTGSDMAPIPVAGGTSLGTAVYSSQIGPADVDNAGGVSPYGIMGLGGNVYECEESEFDLVNNAASSDRGVRGGTFSSELLSLSSLDRGGLHPQFEGEALGFRVASLSSVAVPEPNSLVLLVLTGVGVSLTRGGRALCKN